jgi:hypothetical protein
VISLCCNDEILPFTEIDPSCDLKRFRGERVVSDESEGFLRGDARIGVIASDLRILEFRLRGLEGEAREGGTGG